MKWKPVIKVNFVKNKLVIMPPVCPKERTSMKLRHQSSAKSRKMPKSGSICRFGVQ